MDDNKNDHSIRSLIPPRPGMEARYRCINCDRGFFARIPIFGFFGLQPKCPHCGNRQTALDKSVVY